MKLSPEKIEALSASLLDALADVDGVLFRSDDSDLRIAIAQIVTDELMVAYKYEITMGRLNYDELYRKLRSKLISERRIVL